MPVCRLLILCLPKHRFQRLRGRVPTCSSSLVARPSVWGCWLPLPRCAGARARYRPPAKRRRQPCGHAAGAGSGALQPRHLCARPVPGAGPAGRSGHDGGRPAGGDTGGQGRKYWTDPGAGSHASERAWLGWPSQRRWSPNTAGWFFSFSQGKASEWQDHLTLHYFSSKARPDSGEALEPADAARLFEEKLKAALLAEDGQLALSRLAGTTVSTLMPKIETQGQVGAGGGPNVAALSLSTLPPLPSLYPGIVPTA